MIRKYVEAPIDKVLVPIIRRVKISPNALTVIGFCLNIVGAYFVWKISIVAGVLILTFSMFFDMFDGLVARTNNKTSNFGEVLDSFLDRISDGLIYIALMLRFSKDTSFLIISSFAILFSYSVSYLRAKGEKFVSMKNVGIFERTERLILLGIFALLGLPKLGVYVVLIGSIFTVIQRTVYIAKNV